MMIKKIPSKKTTVKSHINKERARVKSADAYGDKTPICANTRCALRKKTKCSGFEGCPGYKAK